MLIREDSLSHKGGSKLWPFFTIPFGSPSLLKFMALTTSLSILMLESKSERQNYASSILTCLQNNIVISPNTKHNPFFDHHLPFKVVSLNILNHTFKMRWKWEQINLHPEFVLHFQEQWEELVMMLISTHRT